MVPTTEKGKRNKLETCPKNSVHESTPAALNLITWQRRGPGTRLGVRSALVSGRLPCTAIVAVFLRRLYASPLKVHLRTVAGNWDHPAMTHPQPTREMAFCSSKPDYLMNHLVKVLTSFWDHVEMLDWILQSDRTILANFGFKLLHQQFWIHCTMRERLIY